ncbi:MAG: hypothetical protein ACPGEG_04325 [Salibacteraceae bacterium]
MMKKLAIILGVLLVSATVLSSCKSHERCPAYSKTAPKAQQG